MSSPVTHAYGATHMRDFKKYSRRFKTLPQLRIEEVKNLSLDGYRAMLNIRPLGEGVP
jgi:protein tyrosine phosphatase (PTP) superfamily phosphohydrolase (DUF442 family)